MKPVQIRRFDKFNNSHILEPRPFNRTLIQNHHQGTCESPKNPFHFENGIFHRIKLKKTLENAVDRQAKGIYSKSSSILNIVEKKDEFPDPSTSSILPKLPVVGNLNRKIPDPAIIMSPHKVITSIEQVDLDNLALVHEIALNKDFKFSKVNSSMNKHSEIYLPAQYHHWQQIDKALKTTARHKPLQQHVKNIVLEAIGTFKTILRDLISPHNILIRARIEKELDITQISMQMDQNYFDFEKVMHFVVDELSHICCGIREAEIVEVHNLILSHAPFSCQVWRILELVENISLDLTNFAISQSRPYLIENCVVYERQKFAGFLTSQFEKGGDLLSQTKLWIKVHAKGGWDFNNSITRAFAYFLDPNEYKYYPETLALDWHRFPPIREDISRVALVAAVIAAVYNFSIALANSASSASNFEGKLIQNSKNLVFLGQLRGSLNKSLEQIAEKSFEQKVLYCVATTLKVIDEFLKTEKCTELTDDQKKIVTDMVQVASYHHVVTYKEHIIKWFIDVALAGGDALLLVPSHLKFVDPIILGPVIAMNRVVSYNRGVFDIVYRDIYKNLNDLHKFNSNIPKLVSKLKRSKGPCIIYRKSQMDPRLQPKYDTNGMEILPPEREKMKKRTRKEEKLHRKDLLMKNPTLCEDFSRVIPKSKENEKITREDIVKWMGAVEQNKLKRLLSEEKECILKERIRKNLPVFDKTWREGTSHLQNEYCRLLRVNRNGREDFVHGQDEPYPREKFEGSCHKTKKRTKKRVPERVIISRNRGSKFSESVLNCKYPTEEYDFSRFQPDNVERDENGRTKSENEGYITKAYKYY